MEWKKFEHSTKEFPEKTFLSFINGFSAATEYLVDVILKPVNKNLVSSNFNNDFIFEAYLISEFLPNYRFKILRFGYNVDLTTILMEIEDSIHDELYNHRTIITVYNDQFEKILGNIFNTIRLKEIVSGLMKLATKNRSSTLILNPTSQGDQITLVSSIWYEVTYNDDTLLVFKFLDHAFGRMRFQLCDGSIVNNVLEKSYTTVKELGEEKPC